MPSRGRFEIMRALSTKPQFILLDEPFAGIDPLAVVELQKIIIAQGAALGILISDHNVRETLQVCDFAYIVKTGSVLTSGVAGDIIESEIARSCEKFFDVDAMTLGTLHKIWILVQNQGACEILPQA